MSDEERRENVVIDADTKAEIKMMALGRVEDKALIQSLASDVKEMTKNISAMAIAITEQTKNNEHVLQRVEVIENKIDGDDGLAKRTRKLENDQTGNGVRWKVVIGAVGIAGALGTAFVSILGSFVTPVNEALGTVAATLGEILKLLKDSP